MLLTAQLTLTGFGRTTGAKGGLKVFALSQHSAHLPHLAMPSSQFVIGVLGLHFSSSLLMVMQLSIMHSTTERQRPGVSLVSGGRGSTGGLGTGTTSGGSGKRVGSFGP